MRLWQREEVQILLQGSHMTDPVPSKDRVAELRALFDEAGRWDTRHAFRRAHTAELFRIIDMLRRERDASATVAGRALTELHDKCTAPEPRAVSAEAEAVLINAAQLIDGIKNTTPHEWTEWDQQVRDSISALLATRPTQSDMQRVVDARASQPPRAE